MFYDTQVQYNFFIIENIAKNMARAARRQLEGRPAIWKISAELDKPKRALLKMNLTSMDPWRLACFSHVFKVGVILNE